MTDGHGRSDDETVDPVTLEVIDNRFDEAVRTMQHVMFRTGYSTIIRDSKDGSAGICLPDGRVIGQAFRLPLHCGVFPPTIRGIRDTYADDEIEDGDAFVVNDPYRCGANHSPDLLVATPVFYDGELQAFCASIAHKPDIGGLVPGTSSPDAREIFHEGLLLPPVKYRRAGAIDDDIDRIIRNNSRTPEVTAGDVRGQVGSTTVGVEKVRAIFEEYGTETVRRAAASILRSTTARIQGSIDDWDGSVRVQGVLDNAPEAGEPIDLRLEVSTVAGDGRLTFDFRGTDPQTPGPSNMRPHVVKSACYYGLVGVLDASLALNSGVGAVCDFNLPERSVVNPARPAPCNNYSKGMSVVVHMALRALSTFHPAGAVAESGGKMSIAIGSRTDPSSASSGADSRESAGDFVHYEIMGSGYGGHAEEDGASCMASSYESNAELASIEIVETEFDDRVTRFAVRPDSAGAGANRGGVGFVREYEALAPLTFTYRGSNHGQGSQGVAGGGDAPSSRALHHRSDGDVVDLDVIDSVPLDAGDRVRLLRPGGAGYGDPLTRDPARVLDDVRDGFVSVDGARTDYGVVIVEGTDGLDVDAEATASLRARRGTGTDRDPA